MFDICWYGPAFGDSDDENISLDNEFGGDMDDPGGDLPDQACTILMDISQIQHLIYCTYIAYGTYKSKAASTCHSRACSLKTMILGVSKSIG